MERKIALIVLPFLALIGIGLYRLGSFTSEPAQAQINDPVVIIAKYKEALIDTDDAAQQSVTVEGRISELLDEITEGDLSIGPFVEFQAGSAEAQLELNQEAYPERAERVDEAVPLPNFDVTKKVTVERLVAQQALDLLVASEEFEYVELEGTPVPASPDDTYYLTERSSSGGWLDSWALRKIGLNPTADGNTDSGWDDESGSSDVVVAVYGTGIDYTHPDLIDNIWVNPDEDLDHDGAVWDEGDLNGEDDDGNGYIDDLIGWSFSNRSGDVYDDGSLWAGHDTQVAGIIGAVGNNGQGTVGVNWNVKLMTIQYGGYAQTIQYATDNGADIVNLSWSGGGVGLKEVVDYAYANGTIVVFSAGNNGGEYTVYNPALSDRTWLIGATDLNDNKYSWSNYGARVDFTAPGGNVMDTLPSDMKGSGMMTLNRQLSLTVTPAGKPALAYYNPEDDILRYGVRTDGVWTFEEVDSGNFAGMYVSLAFAGDGTPHVAYYDWDDYCLKYATKAGGNWLVQTPTGTNDQGYFSAIAVGTDGYPRIAYLDRTTNELKFMAWSGSAWSSEVAVSTGGFSSYYASISMVLDTSDNPHLSFWKANTSDLGYAVKRGGVWSITYPDMSGSVGGCSDITLDSSGNPHIAYTDLGSYDVKYASYNGATWSVQTVMTDGNIGYLTNSIVINGSSQPEILAGTSAGYLYLATYTGSEWTVSLLTGAPSSLGFTNNMVKFDGSLFMVSTSRKRGIYEGAESGGVWSYAQVADWGNPYSTLGGTSAAAPMTSGLAALLIANHPDWTLDQIYWAVASSVTDVGDPGYDSIYGWGRINAKAALDIPAPLEDTTASVAQITYPSDGSTVEAGVIAIAGSATDTNFTRYNLYYKKTTEANWTTLDGYARTQKNNETFLSWNTTAFSGGDYTLKLEVSDFYQTTTAESTFTLDVNERPAVSLSGLPDTPTSDSTPVVGGTATDDGTVQSVEYKVDSNSDPGWSACAANDGTFNSASEEYTCTVSEPLGEGSHTLYARAIDNQSVKTTLGSYAAWGFTVDTVAPTNPSVLIASGAAYSNLQTVSLALRAVDNTSGVSQMLLSERADFVGASWVSYITSRGIGLSGGDGAKTIYVKYRDGAGNESSTAQDTIVVDTVAPAISLAQCLGWYSTGYPSFLGTATEATSSVANVQVSINNSSWRSATSLDGGYNSQSERFTISYSGLGEGNYVLRYRASDVAGNTTGAYVQCSFGVDLTRPIARLYSGQTRIRAGYTRYIKGYSTDNRSGVSSVVYKIDNGSWKNAVPLDGRFSSKSEVFLASVRGVTHGYHRIYFMAYDNAGNRMRTYSYRLYAR